MQPNLKKTLRALSLELRHILEGHYDQEGKFHPGDLERRLNSLGVWRDRPPKPVDELPHLSPEDREARKVVDAYLAFREEAGVGREEAVSEFIRESAYTWANRLLALRCMEARGIIDEVILQKEAYGGRSLEHHRFAKKNPEACAGEDDGLFAVLSWEFEFMSQELPALFDPQAPAISLRPSVPALKRCIALLSGTETLKGQEPATDEIFEAPDALGWAYQYWNAEEKDRVFEKVRTKKGAKIEGADIIPATQLYTEPYMVKFLVQNSLGATWMGMHPESMLMKDWEYYVKDADRVPPEPKPISEVTFLDPACGSGHFLLEAFDLYYSMYQEEDPSLSPEEICSSILSRSLFGIDIDERAVQIAQAALWMKAKEYAPEFSLAPIAQEFSSHLVATNIRLPKGRDHLQAFLAKHPEDEPLRTALEAVFEGLENVHELGSLLQIEEPVEKELRYLQRKYEEAMDRGGVQQNLLEKTVIQGELPLRVESYEDWKERVVSRLKEHFHQEAESSDHPQSFFGQSAGKGLALFDLLSRRYDVVAANPPYMGSKNMGNVLKNYIIRHYEPAKRDTYAAFIMRCLELCNYSGRVAMVAQQSWMFLSSFTKLRAFDESYLEKVSGGAFKGLLRNTSFEVLAHLGARAFEEVTGEVVNTVLFVSSNHIPTSSQHIVAFRLVGVESPRNKEGLLKQACAGNASSIISRPLQRAFLNIPKHPIVYWLSEGIVNLLETGKTLEQFADPLRGLDTCDMPRFIRMWWEVPFSREWRIYLNGGKYQKWSGLRQCVVYWRDNGNAIKAYPGSIVPNEHKYCESGLTFSDMCSGSFNCRIKADNDIFGVSGSSIFYRERNLYEIAGVLNSRIASYILRAISPTSKFRTGYIRKFPYPELGDGERSLLIDIVRECISLKSLDVAGNILEYEFDCVYENNEIRAIILSTIRNHAVLHSFEGMCEHIVFRSYNLPRKDVLEIIEDTGIPSGWFPVIEGYDCLPELPLKTEVSRRIGIKSFLKEVNEIFQQSASISLPTTSIDNTKTKLKEYYEAGIGTSLEVVDIDSSQQDEDDLELTSSGARIPIPPETFLEELSQKLQIHPISVYWMLKEGIEKEGWRCIPEEKRIIEDRFTVIVLRLLGHRWPKQIEAGEQVPDWADKDGIIPITKGTGEKALYERVRERIAEEFPGREISSIEKEFEEVVGTSLEKWLSGPFYKRHISQFKKRPIAWQLQSQPQTSKGRGKRGISAQPAFSCLVYYHKLDLDFLPKIRTQYVGPLRSSLETELRTLEKVKEPSPTQSARKAQLELWIEELNDFDARLASVSLQGFDCDKLKKIVQSEPLDEWTSRDGIAPPPSTREEFYLQEKRYDPDINDGVRVNIAPLQKAGLLAADVLVKKDLDKAISDRAEWRADERRWCREGKLPRPGWWKEQV